MRDTLGDRIAKALDMCGWNQSQLADAFGVSKGTITRYIDGTIKRFEVKDLEQIAGILGVQPEWLIGWSDEPKPAMDLTVPTHWIQVLGRIAAGVPLLAAINIEDQILVPDALDVQFALKVKGDSMTGASIHDGSIVLCREQNVVEDGQIAVCMIDNEDATLKRFYRHDGIVILRAENPAYRDIVFTAKEAKQLSIIGRAIMVVTMLK